MLELKKFPSESNTNNTVQFALLSNEKWPYQIPWARLWAIQVLLGRGVLVKTKRYDPLHYDFFLPEKFLTSPKMGFWKDIIYNAKLTS